MEEFALRLGLRALPFLFRFLLGFSAFLFRFLFRFNQFVFTSDILRYGGGNARQPLLFLDGLGGGQFGRFQDRGTYHHDEFLALLGILALGEQIAEQWNVL